jgi:NADH-quinone oxidoreductase subunit L
MHRAYHATHSHEDAQDMRNMGGLARYMPWTAPLMWIATLAIAGIPPFAGFFSKDEILGAAFAEGTVRPAWYVFWAMGIGAALLTAFYMTRLMLYTFHGPNRTGEREREYLHEAPWSMTGPLLVLGALTVAGGALNVPPLLGGGASLEHWLDPVTAAASRVSPLVEVPHATEWALVVGAVIVAVLGIMGAVRLLRPEALVPARAAPPESGLARVLWKKWYVDELYEAVFVRPIMWVSREVLWKIVDIRIVDGLLVDGTAVVTRALGWIGSRLQTGEVGVYVVGFVFGVLAVLVAALR